MFRRIFFNMLPYLYKVFGEKIAPVCYGKVMCLWQLCEHVPAMAVYLTTRLSAYRSSEREAARTGGAGDSAAANGPVRRRKHKPCLNPKSWSGCKQA